MQSSWIIYKVPVQTFGIAIAISWQDLNVTVRRNGLYSIIVNITEHGEERDDFKPHVRNDLFCKKNISFSMNSFCCVIDLVRKIAVLCLGFQMLLWVLFQTEGMLFL